MLGVMLVGIVAMQVEVLKLGASVGRALTQSAALQSKNQMLRATVAAESADQRIEQLAASGYGMVMPDRPGSCSCRRTRPERDPRRAQHPPHRTRPVPRIAADGHAEPHGVDGDQHHRTRRHRDDADDARHDRHRDGYRRSSNTGTTSTTPSTGRAPARRYRHAGYRHAGDGRPTTGTPVTTATPGTTAPAATAGTGASTTGGAAIANTSPAG